MQGILIVAARNGSTAPELSRYPSPAHRKTGRASEVQDLVFPCGTRGKEGASGRERVEIDVGDAVLQDNSCGTPAEGETEE